MARAQSRRHKTQASPLAAVCLADMFESERVAVRVCHPDTMNLGFSGCVGSSFRHAVCNMDLRWPPASFWAWMQSASVLALTATKEAIEQEIANIEAQEKAAFLQFWKDHPVPCNRCCRHYHGGQQCPFPCAHTSTDPDQWLHHSANEWHRCDGHWFV